MSGMRTGTRAKRQAWAKKFKGNSWGGAWIYTHPDLQHAIVNNHHGVSYRGQQFQTVREAMAAALEQEDAR